MKKLLISVFMAAIIFGVSNVSAAAAQSARTTLRDRAVSVFPSVSLASSGKWIANHRFSVLGGTALFAGVVLMYKTCPWFKKLVGCEENDVTRVRRLDSRVVNPKRSH